MVKIQSNTDRSFLINGVPYQKGAYEISPLSNETQIKIVRVGSDTVVKEAPLSQWVDGADAPFANFAAFVSYTEPFFFRSVSGGGGGSVNSVTGDGVGGTATDVVLTFPTSNEVANDSLIPGANVTFALNELGVATSGNATDINTLQTNNTGTNTGDETTLSIQSKRPLKTVNGNSLEGTGDVAISGFDPVSERVLTGYESAQDKTISSTSSTAGVTYLNLNYPGAIIGQRYKFTVSVSISHSATNSNAFIDIKDFGVSILNQIYTVEPKDTGDRNWVNLSGEVLPNPLGGGQFQIQLDYGTDDAADTTTVYFAYISIQKVN